MTDKTNPMFKKTEYTSLSKPAEPVKENSKKVKESFYISPETIVQGGVILCVLSILFAVVVPTAINLMGQ